MSSDFLSIQTARRQQAAQSLLAQYDQEDAVTAQAHAPVKAPQGQAQPVPQASAVPPQPSLMSRAIDDMKEALPTSQMDGARSAYRVLGGAASDVGVGLWNTGNDAYKLVADKLLDAKVKGLELESRVPQPTTTTGKLARGTAGFLVPYLGALKAYNAVGAASKIAKVRNMMAAGATADLVMTNPDEKNLVGTLQEIFPDGTALHNSFVNYLAGSEDDSNIEKRFKGVLIGAGLSVPVEAAFALAKAAKGALGGSGKAAKTLQEATAKAAAEKAAQPQPTATGPTLADNIAAMATRRETAAQRKAAGRGPKRVDPAPIKDTEEAVSAQASAGRDAMDADGLNASRDALPEGTREARNRADAELGFTDPLHQKQLDQWEKIAEQTEAARAASEAEAKKGPLGRLAGVLKGVADDAPARNTRLILEGVEPHIGRPGDPIVESLDNEVGKLFHPEFEAAGTPRVLTEDEMKAAKAHSALQDEAIDALRKSVEETRKSRPLSQEAREFLKDLAAQRTGLKPKGTPEEITKALLEHTRAKDVLIRKAEAALNPDGTLNLPKGPGVASPSDLARIILGSDKGALAAGAGAGVAGMAGAEDGEESQGGFSAGSAIATALAGYAAYKLAKHGGRKAFEFAKGLKAMDPLAESLAAKEVRGLTSEPLDLTKVKKPISKDSVNEFVQAAMDGKLESMAAQADASAFNFERLNTPESVKQWLDAFSVHAEAELDRAAGGVQNLTTIEQAARDLGMTMGDAERVFGNTKDLSKKVTAMRMALTASAAHARMVFDYAATHGTPEAILAARQAEMRHALLHNYMKGTQTEIARAMSAMRIVVGDADVMRADLHVMLESMGGYEENMKHVARMRDLAIDPVALARVGEKTALSRTRDALFENFVSAILSGPATQVRNVAGNAAVLLTSIIERQAAVGIGMAKKALNPAYQGMAQREVTAYTGSLVDGFRASLAMSTKGRNSIGEAIGMYLRGDIDGATGLINQNRDELGGFWTSLLLGQGKAEGLHMDPFSHMKLNQDAVPKFSSQYLGGADRSFMGMSTDGTLLAKGIDYLGSAMRTPLRALKAADDAFKSAIYHGEMSALAYRDGLAAGLEGKELNDFAMRAIENPTQDMRDLAINAANKGTFSGSFNPDFKWMNQARSVPGVRWILPIMTAPMNAVGWVAERTPILRKTSLAIQADMAAGGVRADQANAKLAVAGGIVATAYMAAAAGWLTGYEDKNMAAERLSGPDQYSLKVGDGTFVKINSMSGVGTLLGLAADLHQISAKHPEFDLREAFGALLTSVYKNVGSQTMLAGWADFTDALASASRGGDQRKWTNWVNGFAASQIPLSGLLKSMAHVEDPHGKELWTLAQSMKAKLPFFSKDVPNRVDALGRDVDLSLSPFEVSQDSEDAGARELRRLNVDIPAPPRALSVGSGMPGVDLTPEQYYKLRKEHGKQFRESLNALVQSPGWGSISEAKGDDLEYRSDKERYIKTLYAQTGQAAKAKFLHENQDVLEKMQNILQGRPH